MKETVRITKHARLQLKETSIIPLQKGEYLAAYRIETTLVLKKCSPDDMGYKVRVGKNLEITVPKTYLSQLQLEAPTHIIVQYFSNCIMISVAEFNLHQEKDLSQLQPLPIAVNLNLNHLLLIPAQFRIETPMDYSAITFEIVKQGLRIKRLEPGSESEYHMFRNKIYIPVKLVQAFRLTRCHMMYMIQIAPDTFLISKYSVLEKEAMQERKRKSQRLKEMPQSLALGTKMDEEQDKLLKREQILEQFVNTHYLYSK